MKAEKKKIAVAIEDKSVEHGWDVRVVDAHVYDNGLAVHKELVLKTDGTNGFSDRWSVTMVGSGLVFGNSKRLKRMAVQVVKAMKGLDFNRLGFPFAVGAKGRPEVDKQTYDMVARHWAKVQGNGLWAEGGWLWILDPETGEKKKLGS